MRALKSITKIKDCPSFMDFRPTTDLPEFGKHNLIYGWNGSGKTSLSRILRSFELEKNYFDNPSKPSEFELKLDDNTVISHTNLSGYKEVRVFNSDFVKDSVFCASGPKPLFYLGKESKESKEKIVQEETDLATLDANLSAKKSALDKAIESKEKALSVKARDIKNALTTTKQDKYRNYDKTSIESAINNYASKLANPSSLILTDEKLEVTQKAIQQTSKEKITPIPVETFDLTGVILETTELVKKVITSKVIDSLKSEEDISKWVEHGLNIHKEKQLTDCAFCNQSIPQQRLNDLENHFNLEYQKTLDEIKILREKLHLMKLATVFHDSSSFYEDLSSEYILAKSTGEKFVTDYNTSLDTLLTALDEKQKNLFKTPVVPSINLVILEPFKQINIIIEKHNSKTDNFELQISADKESLELHFLANFITLHKETIKLCVTLDSEYKSLVLSVSGKAAEIKKLKEGLISHHIPAQKINEDLEKFLGRPDIQIKATNSQDGYQITRNGIVAKNLSEGEETALAVVYFLAKIKEDGFDIQNGTIVIDDPVSSLDSNSIFLAFSFIKESIKEAGQIIILTHHFDFFRQVKNWFQYMAKNPHKESASYFMTTCKNDTGVRKSNLIKLDKLLLDFESEYHFIFNILYCFSQKKQEELSEIYSLPNTARKFLESFLAFRVPITVGVTNIDARLAHIDFDSVRKTRINRFVQTHSHPRYEAGIQDFDMSLLAEASEVIADLLAMVKTEDEKHYNHLVKSVDPTVSTVGN
jgi:wobble nucleotide-excising tRNase